jgi:hypothetical protein
MPSSYREPEARPAEPIVYFDYAKSLASRKRPIAWRPVLRMAALNMLATLVVAAVMFAVTGHVTAHIILGPLGVLVTIPLALRHSREARALGDESFSSVTRGQR